MAPLHSNSNEANAAPGHPNSVDREPPPPFGMDGESEDINGPPPPPYNPYALSPPVYTERDQHNSPGVYYHNRPGVVHPNNSPGRRSFAAVTGAINRAMADVSRIRFEAYHHRGRDFNNDDLVADFFSQPWALRSAVLVHDILAQLASALIVEHPARVTTQDYHRAVQGLLGTLLEVLELVVGVVADNDAALNAVEELLGEPTPRDRAPDRLARACVLSIERHTAALGVWPRCAWPAHSQALIGAVETAVGFLAQRQAEDVRALGRVLQTVVTAFVQGITRTQWTAGVLGPLYCRHAQAQLVAMGYVPPRTGLWGKLRRRLRRRRREDYDYERD